MSAGHEDTCFTQVLAANVALPGSGRPEPAATKENSVDLWKTKVDVVENASRRCREVHDLLMEQGKLSEAGTGPLGPESLGLKDLVDQLKEMREEREARAESLIGQTAKCAEAEAGCQSQMRTSSETFRAELEALQKKQSESNEQIEILRKERTELKERLKVLEAKLKDLQDSSAQLARNEQRLMGNMEHNSQELCNRLTDEESRQLGLAEQRRVILGILQSAREVEAGIEARAVTAARVCSERESICYSQPVLLKACQKRETARLAAIEELCAAWHGVIWGPSSKDFSKDPQKVEELRAALKVGASFVERAWRDSVQLAADSLGNNTDEADDVSKAASDTGARYKQLGTQLQGDLTRVTGWLNGNSGGAAPPSGKVAPNAGYPASRETNNPPTKAPSPPASNAVTPSTQQSNAPMAEPSDTVSKQEIAEDDAE